MGDHRQSSNQTFAVAIQIGLLGAIVLWSMWIAHFRLFRGDGSIAWFGTVVVVENVVSSTVHSHLFDFAHRWLYVFGVGVLGGMALHKRAEPLTAEMGANMRNPDTRSNPEAIASRVQNFERWPPRKMSGRHCLCSETES